MTAKLKSERIWEIDAARGIGILCVVAVHAFLYLSDFSSVTITWNPFFAFIQQYAGSFFVLLSGMAVYLGSKSFKRGVIVFLCGCVLTALTQWLYLSGREGKDVLIQWGVLHLIGFCMMVYPLIRKLSWKILIPAGVIIIIIGNFVLNDVYITSPLFFPLGLRHYEFYAWDYFPIIPEMGWFLLGNGISRIIYKDKKSLLPNWNTDNPLIKFFCLCGRNSLQIYMLQMILFYPIAKKL